MGYENGYIPTPRQAGTLVPPGRVMHIAFVDAHKTAKQTTHTRASNYLEDKKKEHTTSKLLTD